MPAKKAKGPVAKKMSMQAMLSWLEDELVETTFDKLIVLPEGEFARQTNEDSVFAPGGLLEKIGSPAAWNPLEVSTSK